MKRPDPRLTDRLQDALEGAPGDPGLEPLAKIARQLQALPPLEPPSGAVDRGLARVERAAARGPRGSAFRRRGFYASLASLAAVVFVVAAVASARTSLPGHVLYPVKRATEDVRLMLTKNPEGRVDLCVNYSQRRCDEFIAQARGGDVRPGTLRAMLRSAQSAQNFAEVSPAATRGVLIAQVGQQCLRQGLALQDASGWISAQDTAVINAAIRGCMSRCRDCSVCPSDHREM